MKIRSNRFPLSSYLAATLLAGCSISPPPIGAPGAIPESAGPTPHVADSHTSGPLLYVAHLHGRGSHSHSVISILSLRHDKVLATITDYGYVAGVCSDASGNVWVSNRRHRWYVDEFARGGTKAIEELPTPRRWSNSTGCAVDPISGDLAVTGENIDGIPYVLIWNGARSGKPATYRVPFCPLNAAYDDGGNLFITGWGCDSDFFFEFGELAKGSSGVKRISLDKPVREPGSVQWDGTDVAVATRTNRHQHAARLYRVQVSGTTGKVVGAVQLHGLAGAGYSGLIFVLHDGDVIAPAGASGERIWVWPYPRGGKPTRSIATYESMNAIAIAQ
jgi:hypothetical protein